MRDLPTDEIDYERLLDEHKAAAALDVSASFLQKDRVRKDRKPTVPFVRIGRKVRYHPAEIRKIRGDS